MKKTIIFTMALSIMTLVSCSDKKTTSPTPQAVENTAITDSAFQNAAAGEYKSYDGSKSITLTNDFSVSTKNCEQYYKWELIAQPQDSVAMINVSKKGIDSDIQIQAQLDLVEGALTIKNETYRKAENKK